ncbi:tripartite tricarboxylate transporter substrate-binding protein [Cupriavidus basilensis]
MIQISAFPLVLEVHPSSPLKRREGIYRRRRQQAGRLQLPRRRATARRSTWSANCSIPPPAQKMQHVAYKGRGTRAQRRAGCPGAGDVRYPGQFAALYQGEANCGRWRSPPRRACRLLPDVPTLAEAGLPGFEFVAWHGIAVPAATPREIVLKLQRHHQHHLCRSRIPQTLGSHRDAGGGQRGTPEAFGTLIRSETTRLGKIVHGNGRDRGLSGAVRRADSRQDCHPGLERASGGRTLRAAAKQEQVSLIGYVRLSPEAGRILASWSA